MGSSENNDLREQIISAIRTVKDPEIPVNLYDLGLIYDIDIAEHGDVAIRMTLTTPNCPVAESMPGQVHTAVQQVDGVDNVSVELVWEPAWTGEMMSEEARDALEMMGINWRDPHTSAGPTQLTFGRTGRPRADDR